MKKYINILVYFFAIIPYICSTKNISSSSQCNTLLVGQYTCDYVIDENTQELSNCTPQGVTKVACKPVKGVQCNNEKFNGSEVGFYKEVTCRYTNGYSYTLAVGLSLFLGWLGVDRFYLGYPAIGMLKLCTFGFFGIGAFFDFLLIMLQVVVPADGSNYTINYFGPRIIHIFLNDDTYYKPQPD